jgi:hypothetical protein
MAKKSSRWVIWKFGGAHYLVENNNVKHDSKELVEKKLSLGTAPRTAGRITERLAECGVLRALLCAGESACGLSGYTNKIDYDVGKLISPEYPNQTDRAVFRRHQN